MTSSLVRSTPKPPRPTHPPLGARVRWTQRAGRYYFWAASEDTYSGDPDMPEPEDRVSTRDGIPEVECERIIAELSYSDEDLAMDGHNLNHGTCRIHVWDETGEGVLVGMTSRTVFERTQDDNTLEFTGMAPGKTTQFYEVRTSLRGRRMLVPLDALETIDA